MSFDQNIQKRSSGRQMHSLRVLKQVMPLIPSVFHNPNLAPSASGVVYSTGPAGVSSHGFIAAFGT